MNILKKHFLQKVAKGTKSLRLGHIKFSNGAVFAFALTKFQCLFALFCSIQHQTVNRELENFRLGGTNLGRNCAPPGARL